MQIVRAATIEWTVGAHICTNLKRDKAAKWEENTEQQNKKKNHVRRCVHTNRN